MVAAVILGEVLFLFGRIHLELAFKSLQTRLHHQMNFFILLTTFNVRTLMGIGQQTYLPCTRETRETDVRHVQKTRIQDLSSVIRLKSPSSTSVKFYLRLLVVQALM